MNCPQKYLFALQLLCLSVFTKQARFYELYKAVGPSIDALPE